LLIILVGLTAGSSVSESLAKSSDATDPMVSVVLPLSERPGESFEMKLISRVRLRGVFTSLDRSLTFFPLEGVLDLKNVPGSVGSDGDRVSDAVVATDHRLCGSPELLVEACNR
jgi:hypothetical protein